MEAVQLFLNINKPGLNNEWNSQLTATLKGMPAIEQVQIIEENEHSNAQISITYKEEQQSFDDIEKAVHDSGAHITDINIHLPSGVTGIADPYGASAVSLPIEENLSKIEGVLSGVISSKGDLKVVLDTTAKNKQASIDKILKFIASFRVGKR